MTEKILLIPIILPALAGVLCFFLNKLRGIKEALAILVTLINLVITIMLFKHEMTLTLPWFGFGYELIFRHCHFSWFITFAAACFGFLIALYSTSFVAQKPYASKYYAFFLITLGLVNGAVLSDNFLALLFFWEGLLLTLYGFIVIGNSNAYKTAAKAFIIVGISDVCLMFGIGLTGKLAGTFTLSQIHLPLSGLASLAFIFLMIGAISKAGSMPFHSWIPDAALDAPLPFMAFLPATLEKLLGIYLLSRISLDLFILDKSSWLSTLLMIIGALTILLAVMMALIQTDYKRLLSYHAISQVGYMILGIGTCVPIGIVGGIFHMINHATYKCGLFLTGGSVEKQAGTTDLNKLGGLVSRMPITFTCFFITAASISGVPPFNGFFSKELIYDGALERGLIYYIAAALGSFLTAASFLKLGHSAYFGKLNPEHKTVKEAPLIMLLPMIVIAAVCVLFGVYNSLPLNNLIQPILDSARLEGRTFAGMPHNWMLVYITLGVIVAAVLNHLYGVKKSGSGIGAVDHIHHAPGLNEVYDKAEKRCFDPYDIGLNFVNPLSKLLWYLDKGVDWIYERLSVAVAFTFTGVIRKAYNGNYSNYILWAVIGAVIFIYSLLKFYY
jgi:formate hydrogenlyase subunit 3/multisubunit Na+/H+ antiporter MnhD subunit